MGIFARPAELRAARMFAAVRGRRQVLVCEIDVRSRTANLVVVPLPAAAGPRAVEKLAPGVFALGWDGRRRFFDDIECHFVAPPTGRPGGGQAFVAGLDRAEPVVSPGRFAPGPTIPLLPCEIPLDAVELVGSPDALTGVEPSLRDLLARRYPDCVFALCPIPVGFARAFVAVDFEPRDGGRVFFPLLQVTDGRSVPPQATYAHALFGQDVALEQRMLSFDQRTKASGFVPLVAPEAPPFPPFVEPDAPIDLAARHGLLSNEDRWAAIAPPSDPG